MEAVPHDKRIFTWNDVENNPQYETVKYAAEYADYLRSRNTKITGITVVGSSVKGYAKPELLDESGRESDIDYCLLYEDPDETDEKKMRLIDDVVNKYQPDFQDKHNTKFELQAVSRLNMALHPSKQEIISMPDIYVRPLLASFMGDQSVIEKYRNKVRSTLLEFSEDERRSWAKSFAKDLGGVDRDYEKEMERRGLNHEDEGEVDSFIQGRIKLYQEWIDKALLQNK